MNAGTCHPIGLVARAVLRISLRLCVAMALLAPHPLSAQADDPATLLEKARYEQQIRGDVEAAIRIYRSLAEGSGERRDVAARALLELGEAYALLGREGALEAYRRVVTEFTDQTEAVEIARQRLDALEPEISDDDVTPTGFTMRLLPVEAGSGGLSPDGRRAVFVDWGVIDDPALPGRADVAVYDMVDDAYRLVTHIPPRVDTYTLSPVWSRDGGWIAYSQWAEGYTHQQIRVVRDDGSGDRAILDNRQMARAFPVAFASSGAFVVALLQGWDDVYRIGLVPADGGPLTVLKTLGVLQDDRGGSLSLSPDDRFVAYTREGPSGHDVFALAVDGSVEVPVATHPSDDTQAFWTPDGDQVVFMSERTGQRGLWAVDWRDDRPWGEPRLVHGRLAGMTLLGLTASGAPYFSTPKVRSEVLVADVDLTGGGSMGKPSTLPETALLTNYRPAWSPDGERVAWLSRRGPGGEEPHLVVKTLATGDEVTHPIPFALADRRAVRPDWSRDGRHVWVEGRRPEPAARGSRVSYRIDATNGEASRETYVRDFAGASRGDVTEFHFTDGRQAEGLRALGVRLMGQTDFPMFVEGDARLRPGERLIWIRNGVYELDLDKVDAAAPGAGDPMNPEGVLLESLIPSQRRAGAVNWSLSPDGTRLAVASYGLGSDTPNELWVVPLDGGDPVELARTEPGKSGADELPPHFERVRWTPDGERVIYGVHETGEELPEVDIWVVDAGGGTPRHLDLPLNAYELGNLRFDPDGTRIVYTVQRNADELWLAEGLPWQISGRR